MKNTVKFLLVLVPCLFLTTGTVLADPPDHAKSKQVKVVKAGKGFTGGGPPPWAPAHGYRGHKYREYGLTAVPVNLEVGRCNREVIGQILGGAVGGLAGSQIGDGTGRLIAVATGTLLGAVIGGEIGGSMDRADALCMDQALEHAEDGSTIRWNDGERQYSVTPKQTLQRDDGRYCREYYMEADVQGQAQQVYGQACRQADGSWQLIN